MSVLTPNHIREYVEANPKLVARRRSTRYPDLYVLKYKHCVFYDGLWTPELMEMRGLVVDQDYNIVIYPFTKIYNRGEQGADIPLDEEVVAVQKINGFMGCLTNVNGRNIVSTTGSLDSPYVTLAEKYIGQIMVPRGYTYMFEICDPSDPHIISEVSGATLIGARWLETQEMHDESHLDDLADFMRIAEVMRPNWQKMNFRDIVEAVKTVRHEGFVIYGKNISLKIKSPHYLITKFLARKRADKLAVMLMDDVSLREMKKTVDEEFYPLLDYVMENKDSFTSADEQGRIAYIRRFFNQSQEV